MQDAFARAMAQPSGSIEEIDAWLFRVVHNLAVDRRRRGGHALVLQAAVSDRRDELDTRIALWQHVDRLPDRQRAVLYLRFRADLPFATIAQVLGITEGGARANLSRGLETLRRRVTR